MPIARFGQWILFMFWSNAVKFTLKFHHVTREHRVCLTHTHTQNNWYSTLSRWLTQIWEEKKTHTIGWNGCTKVHVEELQQRIYCSFWCYFKCIRHFSKNCAYGTIQIDTNDYKPITFGFITNFHITNICNLHSASTARAISTFRSTPVWSRDRERKSMDLCGLRIFGNAPQCWFWMISTKLHFIQREIRFKCWLLIFKMKLEKIRTFEHFPSRTDNEQKEWILWKKLHFRINGASIEDCKWKVIFEGYDWFSPDGAINQLSFSQKLLCE